MKGFIRKAGGAFGFFHKNKALAFFFFITLAIHIWQRSTGFGWDFSTYVMNAEHIFAGGNYSEILRPPLASALMFPVAFSRAFAEYFFIFFVSSVFLFSSVRLADSLKLDRKVFYVLSLNPFTIFFAFTGGTEMLTLAMLQLSIASLYTRGSGLWMGLLALARYTNFLYFPLLLFQKNIRKIFISTGLIILVFLPWLAYNALDTGDPMTSIADFFALQIQSRDYSATAKINYFNFLLPLNILLPLFFYGVCFRIKAGLEKTDWLMIAILVIAAFSYTIAPSTIRYLYNMALPAAYFSCIAAKKIRFRHLAAVFGAVFVSIAVIMVPGMKFENPAAFKEVASKISCASKSNNWPALSYYGLPSFPWPKGLQIQKDLAEGYRITLFKNQEGYISDPSSLKIHVIENASEYIILGNRSVCKAAGKAEHRYLKNLNSYLEAEGKQRVPEDACHVFLGRFCPL